MNTIIPRSPSPSPRIGREFIAGMGKVRGTFVILLDVTQVLTHGDIDAPAEPADARTPLAA